MSEHTIWKYPLEITDSQCLEIPRVHQFLMVQVQNSVPTLWAIVNPKTPIIGIEIRCHGTGNPCGTEDAKNYLGTVQLNGFVWHYFSGSV